MKTRLLVLALSFGLLSSASAMNPNVNKIRVTHIKFDYKGGSADKGDGLDIRKGPIGTHLNTDLDHKGNGVGLGEWIRDGAWRGPRNDRALWVAKDWVKISVRFEGENEGSATVIAVSKSSLSSTTRLIDTRPREVQFVAANFFPPMTTQGWKTESSGDDGKPKKEYCIFELREWTGESIAKIVDSWEWYYEDDTGKAKRFDVTGDHVVYRVLDVPKSPWYDIVSTGENSPPDEDGQHPWVTALEFAIKTAKTEGIASGSDAITRLTNFIHTDYKLEYNNKGRAGGGTTYYRGGAMLLSSFMRKPWSEVNCADCAAALSSLASLVGAPAKYTEMSPFGYINTTDLIGCGLCNNPFFANDEYVIDKEVDNDALQVKNSNGKFARSFFGMHAFVMCNDLVYDACAGPHRGETLNQYLGNAIDRSGSTETVRVEKAKVAGAVGTEHSSKITLK